MWRNPVGLAAGFDKHIEVLPALEALGFGSAEVGTITPRPQLGNPRPRVFRYPTIRGLVNRYGFNSVGAEQAARNLKEAYSRYRIRMPVGISIGKNKETLDSEAVKDYLEAIGYFLPIMRGADWLKINISSPNTPSLREIFARLDEFLAELEDGVKGLCRELNIGVPPLLLKVPPDDLTDKQLADVVAIAKRYGFSGIEATNTTTDPNIKACWGVSEAGGLSGHPLMARSTEVLRMMKEPARACGMDLIGVGGICESWDAQEKCIDGGAKAVQIYSGLVLRGPSLIDAILKSWL